MRREVVNCCKSLIEKKGVGVGVGVVKKGRLIPEVAKKTFFGNNILKRKHKITKRGFELQTKILPKQSKKCGLTLNWDEARFLCHPKKNQFKLTDPHFYLPSIEYTVFSC